MSTIKVNNVQVGLSLTSTNNFTWYQPAVVDGTVRLGNGNAGATSSDVMTITSAGNVGVGTTSPTYKLDVRGAISFGSSQIGELGGSGGNPYFGSIGALPLLFAINGTEKMRLDSSGNLGLGVTPSAWSSAGNLELPAYGMVSAKGTIYVLGNAYYNGGFKYTTTAAATQYAQGGGVHYWYNAPSGTAGNAISFTQAMTLNSSGFLGIATASPATYLAVGDSSNRVNPGSGYTIQTYGAGNSYWLLNSNTNYNSGVHFGDPDSNTSGKVEYAHNGDYMIFNTAGSERMRITSGGGVSIGNTTSVNAGNLRLGTGAASNYTGELTIDGGGGNGYGPIIAAASGGTAVWYISTYDRLNGGSNKGISITNSVGYGVYLNGATATSWTAVSDETRKVIIEPISDAANKVSTLRAVIGRLKTDDESVRRPYLIAQDVQAVLPEAVSSVEDKNGVVLGLSYTEVIPLLAAAIKELKAELDATKAEVAALKAN